MWLILSLTNAVAQGLQNAYYKKADIQLNPILIVWSVLIVSSIFFSPLFLFGIPPVNSQFWIAVILRVILDSVAFTLYIKALQLSPLTLTVPMLSLVPLFIIITSFFINHLLPTPLGLVGIIITVFGIYYLNFDHDTRHLLSPFKAVYKEKGVRIMVIVAILWSLITAFQKLAIDNSSAYFYTAFFQIFWAVFFTPVAFLADRKGFGKLFTWTMIKRLTPAGFLDAVQVFPQYIAYTLAQPVYVSVVGTTSIIFTSIFGWWFYKEKLDKHIVPTIIIVIGIILITIAQK